MSTLRRLARELHRRSLWQVLLVYGATSWIVLQVVEVLMEGLGLPGWVFPVAIILLLVGLPVVLATAFVQEGGPELRSGDPTLHPELGRYPEVDGTGDVEPPSGPPAGEESGGFRALLTWRNAVIGGVLAFALLGVAVTGYMVMRIAGIGPVGTLIARGALEERETMVLAEFEAPGSSPELGDVVTEAMRIDLHESPVVTVADPARISRALERMGRQPSAPLDEELARELAVREGIAAVLTGRISAVGGRYLLSARLVRPGDGTQLLGEQVEAADSTAILDAIDELSGTLRERIGESLSSVRASERLERVTTSSLEALRKYSQALGALSGFDLERGRVLLREAVALDSTFAMAWRKLGVVHANRNEMAEANAAFERAYALRDRLGDRERYHTEGIYHQFVTEDLDRAAAAYRSLLEQYPEDTWALNNLSIVLSEQGDEDRAEELLLRAIATGQAGVSEYTNLIEGRVGDGRLAGADSILGAFAREYPDHPLVHPYRALISYRQGAYGTAVEAMDSFLAVTPGQTEPQIRGRIERTHLLAALGRFEEAAETLVEALRRMGLAGWGARFVDHAALFAIVELAVLGDTVGAVERVEEALADHPLDEIPVADRPVTPLAALAAMRGRAGEAREYVAAGDGDEAPPGEVEEVELPFGIAMLLAGAQGRWEEVRERSAPELREERCDRFCLALLARAYAATGSPDSARVAYERFLEEFDGGPVEGLFVDALWRARIHEDLASIYREAGRAGDEAEQLRELVALWEDADPPLRPRVERARERLRALEAATADGDGGG